MRILWFSSHPLSDSDAGVSGTWQNAMAKAILEYSQDPVKLGIIATSNVSRFIRKDFGDVHQWLVPARATIGHNGLPSSRLVERIVAAYNEFSPDLTHIWGTEGFWGLLHARGILSKPSLLAIQGLKYAIANVYYGGLTLYEQLQCIGPKELIKRRCMWTERKAYKKWGLFEKEMIQGHHFIGVQSPWSTALVRSINDNACLLDVGRALRQPFMEAAPWKPSKDRVTLFCSTAYLLPFKGIHVAIRALSNLRKRIPNVMLRIAGANQSKGLRRDGYTNWVLKQIRILRLENHVQWLGALPAQAIVTELQNCSAMVVPSHIESYCNALAEAMMLGVPTVSAFTGGTSFLAENEQTALFFPTGDDAMCAHQLYRLLTDRSLAQRISVNAQAKASLRHDSRRLISSQLDSYRDVLNIVRN